MYIFHFLAIENYPPLQNFIRFLDSRYATVCLSTKGKRESENYPTKIVRLGKSQEKKIQLYICYLLFNVVGLLSLIIKRPRNVLYYESISAFPPLIYKRYFNRNARIFVHYHEYTTIEEFNSSSFFNRIFHRLEQKMYSKLEWISHTNQVRLNKFLNDEKITYTDAKHHILPNYPSKDWGLSNTKYKEGEILKFIYVGYAADIKSTFSEEIINYLAKQSIPCILDFYCVNPSSLPIQLQGKIGNVLIEIYQPIKYQQLPSVISQYHIGLILYKGINLNSIHIAPNKLFEYYNCGLDVWYPNIMEGIMEYQSQKFPKVIALDFKNLHQYKLNELIQIGTSSNIKKTYFAEEVYDKLEKSLFKS